MLAQLQCVVLCMLWPLEPRNSTHLSSLLQAFKHHIQQRLSHASVKPALPVVRHAEPATKPFAHAEIERI